MQVKRAFKSCFFVTKNNKKAEILYMKFFYNEYKCAEVTRSPISKRMPPFSAAPPFDKNISNH